MLLRYLYTLLYQDLFRYSGRISRRDYWLGGFCLSVFWIAVVVCCFGLMSATGSGWFLLAFFLTGLWLILAFFSSTARRLHDIGLSGWLVWLWLAPMGNIVLIVMTLLAGEKGENAYGEPETIGARAGVSDLLLLLLYVVLVTVGIKSFSHGVHNSRREFKEIQHRAQQAQRVSQPNVAEREKKRAWCMQNFNDGVRADSLERTVAAMRACPELAWGRAQGEAADVLRMVLRWAVADGDVSSTRFLLRQGISPNQMMPQNNVSLLHASVILPVDAKITEALLEAGANPNLVSDGQTPLISAIMSDKPFSEEKVRLLLAYKANPNQMNPSGLLPLNLATYGRDGYGSVEKTRLLLQYGADPFKKNGHGFSVWETRKDFKDPRIKKMISSLRR